MDLDWQQRHALKLLTTSASVEFKDLIPAGVEPNQFAYHLKKLMSEGYILSTGGTYTLTPLGKHLVGSMSLDNGKPRKQAKIVVMLYATNNEGEVLLYKWHRQPYFDKVSLPYGKTHFDKSLTENVHQEAEMKLSSPVEILSYLGDFYQIIRTGGVTISHMLVHVYHVKVLCSTISSKQPGEPFWGRVDNIEESASVPGLKDIFTWIQTRITQPANIHEIISNS